MSADSDEQRRPLLANGEKSLAELINAVNDAGKNAKSFDWRHPILRRRARKELRLAIDALKARWMSSWPYDLDASGNDQLEKQQKVEELTLTLDAMEAHFPQNDIRDILNCVPLKQVQNSNVFRFFVRTFAPKVLGHFETERPTIQKASQEIDQEIFRKHPFNISNPREAQEFIDAINNLATLGLTGRSRDKNGSTLLHKVLEKLDRNMTDVEMSLIFNALKNLGADFDAKDGNGNTPVHIALRRKLWSVEDGQLKGSALCLLMNQYEASVNIANNKLQDPLLFLSTTKSINDFPSQTQAVRRVLEEKRSPLHCAIACHSVEAFRDGLYPEGRYSRSNIDFAKGRENVAKEDPVLGLPIQHLQKLIDAYESEKRVHSPREWWHHRKLRQMLALFLAHLIKRISADLSTCDYGRIDIKVDDDLMAQIQQLSNENQEKLFSLLVDSGNKKSLIKKRYFQLTAASVDAASSTVSYVPASPNPSQVQNSSRISGAFETENMVVNSYQDESENNNNNNAAPPHTAPSASFYRPSYSTATSDKKIIVLDIDNFLDERLFAENLPSTLKGLSEKGFEIVLLNPATFKNANKVLAKNNIDFAEILDYKNSQSKYDSLLDYCKNKNINTSNVYVFENFGLSDLDPSNEFAGVYYHEQRNAADLLLEFADEQNNTLGQQHKR